MHILKSNLFGPLMWAIMYMNRTWNASTFVNLARDCTTYKIDMEYGRHSTIFLLTYVRVMALGVVVLTKCTWWSYSKVVIMPPFTYMSSEYVVYHAITSHFMCICQCYILSFPPYCPPWHQCHLSNVHWQLLENTHVWKKD